MASIIEIVDEEDYSGLNEEVKHKRTAKTSKEKMLVSTHRVGFSQSNIYYKKRYINVLYQILPLSIFKVILSDQKTV